MKYLSIGVLCLFLFFSFSSKPKRETILTAKAPAPIGPYSQAIKHGNTLYVSGQIALTAQGMLDTGSIENECHQVMENVKAIVEAAGMRMGDVCKASIYTTDLKQFSKINEVYKSYFDGSPPARETIQVLALPKGAHVEISVIANQ